MNYSSKFKFAEIEGNSLEFNAGISDVGVNADIKEVSAKALVHANILLSHWLEGKLEGDEFVALNPSRDDGKLGSFKINVETGRWSDFATGESGGDIVSYYAHVNSLKDNCAYPQQEAANRIACDLKELAKNGRLERCLGEEPEPINCKAKPDYASVLWNTADEIALLSPTITRYRLNHRYGFGAGPGRKAGQYQVSQDYFGLGLYRKKPSNTKERFT